MAAGIGKIGEFAIGLSKKGVNKLGLSKTGTKQLFNAKENGNFKFSNFSESDQVILRNAYNDNKAKIANEAKNELTNRVNTSMPGGFVAERSVLSGQNVTNEIKNELTDSVNKSIPGGFATERPVINHRDSTAAAELKAAKEKGARLREETERYQKVHENDYVSNTAVDDVKVQEAARQQSEATQRSKEGGKVRSKKIAKRTDEIMRANDDIEKAQAVELAKQSLYGPHKPINAPITNSSSQKAQQVAAQAEGTATNSSSQKAAEVQAQANGTKPTQASGGSSNIGKISGGGGFLRGLETSARNHRRAAISKQVSKLAKDGSEEEITKWMTENGMKSDGIDFSDRTALGKSMRKHVYNNMSNPEAWDYVAGNPKTLTAAGGVAVGFGAIATVSSNGGRRSNSSLYGSPF